MLTPCLCHDEEPRVVVRATRTRRACLRAHGARAARSWTRSRPRHSREHLCVASSSRRRRRAVAEARSHYEEQRKVLELVEQAETAAEVSPPCCDARERRVSV